MLDTLEPHRQQILCLVFRHNVNVNSGIKSKTSAAVLTHQPPATGHHEGLFVNCPLRKLRQALSLNVWSHDPSLTSLLQWPAVHVYTDPRRPGDGQWRAERSLVNFDWTHSASNILITWEMGYIRSRYDYLEQSWVNESTSLDAWGGILFKFMFMLYSI